MSKPIVRCRCGHQVLAKEVLRTDLYERRATEGSSREYVYVKYRCQRCKRMGEAFVPESRWDRSILEPVQNEMNDAERDHFLDESPISDDEVLDFHRRLQELSDLNELNQSPQKNQTEEGAAPTRKAEEPDGVTAPQVQSETPTVAATPGQAQGQAQPPTSDGAKHQLPPRPKGSAPENAAPNPPPEQTTSPGRPPEDPHSKVFRGESS
jgi:DNA-directed RNA polymerase subunit RPC12/RpoP